MLTFLIAVLIFSIIMIIIKLINKGSDTEKYGTLFGLLDTINTLETTTSYLDFTGCYFLATQQTKILLRKPVFEIVDAETKYLDMHLLRELTCKQKAIMHNPNLIFDVYFKADMLTDFLIRYCDEAMFEISKQTSEDEIYRIRLKVFKTAKKILEKELKDTAFKTQHEKICVKLKMLDINIDVNYL